MIVLIDLNELMDMESRGIKVNLEKVCSINLKED